MVVPHGRRDADLWGTDLPSFLARHLRDHAASERKKLGRRSFYEIHPPAVRTVIPLEAVANLGVEKPPPAERGMDSRYRFGIRDQVN